MSALDKKTIREEILRRRGQFFTQDDAMQASKTIISQLKNTPAYQSANHIMCFISFGTEVMTHDFIQQALAEGKRIFVPYIPSKKTGMLASELKDFAELEIGYFNILTPKEEFRRITDEVPDLVIVPGVAFAKDGYRVGYGGGFYDRYLSTNRPVQTIGLAYDVQVVESVPVEEFDLPIDRLITEKTSYSFNQK